MWSSSAVCDHNSEKKKQELHCKSPYDCKMVLLSNFFCAIALKSLGDY